MRRAIQQDEFQKNVDFMKRPLNWPRFPVLPIKRWKESERQYECACIVNENVPTVYYANMFELAGRYYADLKKFRHQTYDSFEALVADGWIVD